MRHGPSAYLTSVGHIRERQLGMPGEMFCQTLGRGVQSRRRFCREHEELCRTLVACRVWCGSWSLFEDDMGVGAADTKGADASAARRAARRFPLGKRRIHEEWA